MTSNRLRVFYDTVIFILTKNANDKDHENCKKLFDTEIIKWTVGFSVITRAESTINEYLDQLIVIFGFAGIDWVEVQEEGIKLAIKQKRPIFRTLEKLGVSSRDRRQIFAAFSMHASVMVTRDCDFFDPLQKALKGREKIPGRVSKVVENDLDIKVIFPPAAVIYLTKT